VLSATLLCSGPPWTTCGVPMGLGLLFFHGAHRGRDRSPAKWRKTSLICFGHRPNERPIATASVRTSLYCVNILVVMARCHGGVAQDDDSNLQRWISKLKSQNRRFVISGHSRDSVDCSVCFDHISCNIKSRQDDHSQQGSRPSEFESAMRTSRLFLGGSNPEGSRTSLFILG
jgi:hypothetical protein